MRNNIALSNRPNWGWETANCHSSKSQYKTYNIVKILAYFPFTGTAIGILRIAGTVATVLRGQSIGGCLEGFSRIIRAAIEFTGLGFLTLPLVDLIVTVHRGCSKKAPPATLYQERLNSH